MDICSTIKSKNRLCDSDVQAEEIKDLVSQLVTSACIAAEEQLLSQKLRSMCDSEGKEQNPQQSAHIIHQLGRVYRKRTPDKISLIRSAILFNAALVRKPSNADEIESDLRELCSHVLHLADAQDKDADLIGTAKTTFEDVREMREIVDEVINTVHRISDNVYENQYLEKVSTHIDCLQQVQECIFQCFVKTMKNIMDFAVKVMGDFPCAFALCGMGSLVTKEITPYSDFESFIVLEDGIQHQPNYENKLEYFRWIATIFQHILVSFGETVIYDAAIPSLNHPENKEENWFFDAFTPCGISPDGFYPHASHNPLGRQDFTKDKSWKTELIKPVSEMLKYLDEDEDRKNGFHLADILTKFCFVSGDRDLFDRFESSVKSRISETGISVNSLRLMKDDQQRFGMTKGLWNLQFHSQFDIKRVIYRTITMSVAALGQLHGKDWSSSFDVIDQLDKSFPKHLRIKFKHAVAIACEIRLKSYLANRGRINTSKTGSYANFEFQSTLVEWLGSRGACDFIITALCLQEIAVKVFEENIPFTTIQAPDAKPMSQAMDILMVSLKMSPFSRYVPSTRQSIVANDVTMRLMNYDFNRQVEFFEHEKLMHHYSTRASILLSLEQMKESLECCDKALSLKENAPLSVRFQVHLVLKTVCHKYFADDEKIKDDLNRVGCQQEIEFMSIPADDIHLDAWKRAVDAKQPHVSEAHNLEMPYAEKLQLRALVFSVLIKLGKARLKSLATEPMSLISLMSQASGNSEGSSPLKGFNLPRMMEGLCKVMSGNQSVPPTRSVKEAFCEQKEGVDKAEEERNKKTDEFIDLMNSAAPDLGLAKIEKDREFEKMKNVRTSLGRVLESVGNAATLGITIEMRKLKQLQETGETSNVSKSYPTLAEFESLKKNTSLTLARGIEKIASKQKDAKNISKSRKTVDSCDTSDFEEDELD